MSQDFVFVLNDQYEFKTPFSVKLLYKLGDTIGKKIFSGKYYVQSQVSQESFRTFLDYLYDKKENPELTVDNYYDFQLLSDESRTDNLREYLSKEEFENIKILSILKNSITEGENDLSYCEEYITTKLDYFLENYSNEMREMKTTTLYNIFQHKQRKLKNHERAYEFIKEVIKSGKEGNCVLLKTLDGIELSEESIKETISNKEKNYGFLPEFNLSFISDIKSQMDTIKNQQIQMMNAINSMINEKINSIQNNYLLLSQKIEESNNKIDKIITENEKTKSDIENISQKVIEKIANLSQKIEETNNKIENNKINEKIDKIITENEKTSEIIENLSQKVINIESKVNETFTKSDENSREISDIKEKVELIKIKNSETSTKIIEENEKTKEKIANLTQKIEESNNKIKNFSQEDFELLKISLNANNEQFNGIIRQLTNECGGNVLDKGIVNVTRSSKCSGNPRDVVNLENTEIFSTENEQNSWIKYDFKNKKVSPVCYLIRSCNQNKNGCHLKSWVVEGSNTDSNDWKILDSRIDCMSLNNCNAVQRFTVQQSSDFYRFLRIRQTDKSWLGNYCLGMSVLEFFGFIQ